MKDLHTLPLALLTLLCLGAGTSSCNSDDEDDRAQKQQSQIWDKYADWRAKNNAFFASQRDSLDADGKLFYDVLYPAWNPQAEILIHYFNDRAETAENLQPLLTSTCDVIYYARQSDGTPADSSYAMTSYGRAIARFKPQRTIQGFAIALMDMHVGDSVQIVVPYTLGYGSSTNYSFPPFTTLVYNLRLVDIPYYEINN